MANERSAMVLRYLRRLSGARGAADPTTGHLLDRFVTHRDEEAFAALVERYGPMVLGLCRRVLRNPDDADDAFQATFVVLIRRAGSIARPDLLGNWLYGVAYRTALKARTTAARRRCQEKTLPSREAIRPVDETAAWDLGPVLDEEVNRLPAKYRTPFVLCHLEGKTNEEAARHLGCPLGTVLSRLARARAKLRSRLARRGVAPAVGVASLAVTPEATAAVVSPALVKQTIRAAIYGAAGKTAAGGMTIPAALAEGVLRAMFLKKLQIAGVVLLVLSVVATGGGLLLHAGAGAAPTEERLTPIGPAADRNPDAAAKAKARMDALWKEKSDAVTREMDARMGEFIAGRGTLAFLFDASRRWVEVQRDLSKNQAERTAALEAHLQRTKQIEEMNVLRFQAGRIAITDVEQSRYYRLEAEIWLEQARAK